jgi:hypothetical protein
MRWLIFLTILGCLGSGQAQDCPRDVANGPSLPSASRELHGRVVFHDDLRQWLSLELAKPVCGETTIQIFLIDAKGELTGHPETFRGCDVTTAGPLAIPTTGYYSAALYQDVEAIQPSPGCIEQRPFPDYSKARPLRGVRRYQVRMWFDYTAPQGPAHATIRSSDGLLRPWQAYANYSLTGGFVFYASCAERFSLHHLTATPEANPSVTDNVAALDPETAAEKHIRRIQISYACRR